MDRAFFSFRADAVAQFLIRQVGDHFVGVRVGRGAGASLVNIDREMRIVFAGRHFFAGSDDRFGFLFIEFAELEIRPAQAAFR